MSAATVQAWARRYGYDGINVDDIGQRIAVDSGGNVVVAGYCWSYDSINFADLVVIKYSNAGIPLWTNRYHGPAGQSMPTGVVLDKNGNVFVAGYSYGAGSSEDFITIAYSSMGTPLWTNRYNFPATGQDTATDIKLGGNNTIVVSGLSWNGSNYDFATIAYSTQGTGLWTNRYPAPGGGYVFAPALAVDNAGNIFVSASTGDAPYDDYLTIAYSSSGATLWTNRYNGGADDYDSATAIATDTSGSVFVTGFATDATGENFTTIAYSNSGSPLWTNKCGVPGNGYGVMPCAITADNAGKVIVTGLSWDGTNHFSSTVAYSNAGAPLWTNRYNGLANGYGTVNALAVDQNGSVFVTGYWSNNATGNDYATVAYSATGVPLWTNLYNGVANGDDQAYAIAVDLSGNILVTGTSSNSLANGYDLVTIAYSNAGIPLWTNSLNERGVCNNYANALAVDSSGNVVVTGYSSNRFSGYDYATIKYSSAGVPLWTNRYNGLGNSNDYAVAVAIGSSGNVFVTGNSSGPGGIYAYGTIAYSNSGTPLWTNRYSAAGTGQSFPAGLKTGADGKVFVTGYSYGSFWDFVTLAYSESGTPLWTNRYSRSAISDDEATAIGVQPSGNVIVSGFSDSNTSGYDYVTISYSSTGLPLWTNRYDGPASSDDRPAAVATDSAGNIFVTGYSVGPGTFADYATIAYSSSGTPLWTNRYNSGSDLATAIAVDSTGNVIVTGRSTGAGNISAFATIAYSNQGVPLWTNRWNGPGGHEYSLAVALAIDSNDNIVVAGNSLPNSSNATYNYAIIAYSKSGLPIWTNIYDGPAHGLDQVQTRAGLSIGGDNSIFITGASDGEYSSWSVFNYATVKYVALPVGVSGANLVTSLRIGVPGPNSNTVSFSGIPGNQYIAQFAPAVRGPWININTNFAEPDGSWTVIDPAATNRTGFYRSATVSE